MKYTPPSVKETAYNCPHCGALANQSWFSLCALKNEKSSLLPIVFSPADSKPDFSDVEDSDGRADLEQWADQIVAGNVFLEKRSSSVYSYFNVYNLNFSQCFNCDELTVWIADKMAYPAKGDTLPANVDMPEDIRRDYDEASLILNYSPRGAAALIRLAIQKLCKELGQSGDNINNDIKALVAGGLDSRVQQALDAVRVIGNYAVHPGQIDLRDDRGTAETLFRLLNLIVDKTISEPKHVKAIYDSLPESILKAIEQRDSKAG